jgi:GTPase
LTKYWSPAAIRALARKRVKQNELLNRKPLPVAQFDGSYGGFPEGESLTEEALLADPELSDPTAEKIQNNELMPVQSSGDLSYWSQFVNSIGNRVVVAYASTERDGGEEIRMLCDTLKLEVVQGLSYRVLEPDQGTYVGSGFLGKLRVAAKQKNAGAIVIDAPLSPSQMKNIEDVVKMPVVDREALILSIFQAHARTRQSQLQVELAQFKYLLARLSHLWMGLSRTRGARGGLKGRGLGETRLELDRRIVKKRIQFLSERIGSFDKVFEVQAARRRNLPRVALVGYTNAGKSSLMRRLTKVQVQVENKLFCTLDTTVRPLSPPTEPRILMSDTVGFLKKLPHNLVASFRSTLAEARESRLLLHVVDVSNPLWQEHFETTEAVLEEVGCANIPRILVLNKVDEMPSAHLLRAGPLRRLLATKPDYLGTYYLSALTGLGVPELVERIRELCSARLPEWIQTAK